MSDFISQTDSHCDSSNSKLSIISNEQNNQRLLKVDQKQQERLLAFPLRYFFLIFIISLSFCIDGQVIPLYNVLNSVMPDVYGWSSDQTQLYSDLAGSVPVAGAIASGFLINYLSVKYNKRILYLLFLSFLFIGSTLTLFVNNYMLIIGRVFHGMVVCSCNTFGPMMVREYTPKEQKGYTGGILIMLFRVGQFIVFGLGNLNPSKENSPQNSQFMNSFWRVILTTPMLVAAIQIFCLLVFFNHDTPKDVYMSTQSDEQTITNLNLYFGQKQSQEMLVEIKNLHLNEENCHEVTWKELWQNYRKQIILGFIMSFVFQGCGIDGLLVYSNKLLNQVGDKNHATLFTSLSAVADLLGVVVGLLIVERINRKILFLVSLWLVVVGNFVMAGLAFIDTSNNIQQLFYYCVLFIRFVFALGIETVYWGYLPDILPVLGMSLCMQTFNVTSLTVLIAFPYMINSSFIQVKGTYLIFGGIGTICALIIGMLMKETKGLGKDEVKDLFLRQKVQKQQQNITHIKENNQQ